MPRVYRYTYSLWPAHAADAGTRLSRRAWIARLKHQFWRDITFCQRYTYDPMIDEFLRHRWVVMMHEGYRELVNG